MKVLITAGQVYGVLDDNKIVGNRIRGIWATRFAQFLVGRDFDVTLLVPDINTPKYEPHPRLTVVQFKGYSDYAEKCYAAAPSHDSALLAAAVVNWIPAEPIKGKMRTEGYAEGDIIQVPFVLAARVINRMRKLNPKLTLIGCKMTSGSPKADTIKAAYHTLLTARCHAVVANDLSNLKEKTLVYPDGNAVSMVSFDRMYEDLAAVLQNKFYRTAPHDKPFEVSEEKLHITQALFDFHCQTYRDRFVKRLDGADRVFGSLMVRIDSESFLVSPREKGELFDSKDAVVLTGANLLDKVVFTVNGAKATLNAPLLLRVLVAFDAPAVVHLHDENPAWPTVPYAPPGTVRDNDRVIVGRAFNIEGHGCVFIP
jgi:hypothetical protein